QMTRRTIKNAAKPNPAFSPYLIPSSLKSMLVFAMQRPPQIAGSPVEPGVFLAARIHERAAVIHVSPPFLYAPPNGGSISLSRLIISPESEALSAKPAWPALRSTPDPSGCVPPPPGLRRLSPDRKSGVPLAAFPHPV